MPEFRSTDVDSGQIDNASRGIDNDIKELQSIRAVFVNNVMSSLNPYWQGPAKQSFEEQFSAFTVLFEKLIEGYLDLNEELKKAGIAYNKADGSVMQLIAKLPK